MENNTTDGSGGAIAITDGNPIIDISLFRHNYAEVSGGALYLTSETSQTPAFAGIGTYVANHCKFEGNGALEKGGVAYTEAGIGTFDNCVIGGILLQQTGRSFLYRIRRHAECGELLCCRSLGRAGGALLFGWVRLHELPKLRCLGDGLHY